MRRLEATVRLETIFIGLISHFPRLPSPIHSLFTWFLEQLILKRSDSGISETNRIVIVAKIGLFLLKMAWTKWLEWVMKCWNVKSWWETWKSFSLMTGHNPSIWLINNFNPKTMISDTSHRKLNHFSKSSQNNVWRHAASSCLHLFEGSCLFMLVSVWRHVASWYNSEE